MGLDLRAALDWRGRMSSNSDNRTQSKYFQWTPEIGDHTKQQKCGSVRVAIQWMDWIVYTRLGHSCIRRHRDRIYRSFFAVNLSSGSRKFSSEVDNQWGITNFVALYQLCVGLSEWVRGLKGNRIRSILADKRRTRNTQYNAFADKFEVLQEGETDCGCSCKWKTVVMLWI